MHLLFIEDYDETEEHGRVRSISLNQPLLLHLSAVQLEALQAFRKIFTDAGLDFDICMLGAAGKIQAKNTLRHFF